MALALGMKSPRDMLAKAKRDLARLERAEVAHDSLAISDALMDVAVALDSVRGWLRNRLKRSAESSPSSFTKADVHALEKTLALSSFTDIANEYKHASASPDASTDDVLLSAPSSDLGGSGEPTFPRIKVVRKDLSRHRATDLARHGITLTEAFMDKHRLG
jgi:hypothetical protein